ncbi:putative helix-turn-helix transcriptional regulator [Burkholderiales bacterium GJ-E10]|nr:putative helix-turn-helix transcriptional regulator [Burkholderiales bacterium GJ-E10]
MTRVQVIEKDGAPAFYVVPADLWDRMRASAEDVEDVADIEEFRANDDGVRIPADVAFAVADGTHPVRAWREHRNRTQDQLAAACGLSKPFISQIESGARTGTLDSLRAIARALDIPVGALLLDD